MPFLGCCAPVGTTFILSAPLAMNLNNYSPLGGLAPVCGGGGGLSSCVQLIICTNKSQSILGQGTRKISQFRAYFTVANWARRAMLQRDME